MPATAIYPVIHHLDLETCLAQAGIARHAGADGVFLISHTGKEQEVLEAAQAIKEIWPSFKVGINLLTASPMRACEMALDLGLDMVWADDMGVSSREVSRIGLWAQKFASRNPQILLFASVAFKYQPQEDDPVKAAQNATSLGLIPTTSGEATGLPPSIEKIHSMSQAVDGKLAVASGMTPSNIGQYAQYLSHVLVSTGISDDFHHINPSALNELIAQVKAEA